MKIEWNTTDPAKAIVILSRTQLETEYPDLLKRTMLIVDDHKFGFSKVMNYQNELFVSV